MKRNLRQSILIVLIVLLLINSSCQPNNNYSSQSDFQEDTIQGEYEPQAQPIDMEPMVIFDNINTNPNSDFPPIPPTFTLTESWHITSILVMHWNRGQGAEPGEITILNDQDNVFGTWQAEGVAPEPQFPNTYWVVRPDRILEPGTYIIYDSDPETQSYNTESGNMGMVKVKGFPASGYLNTEGIEGIDSIVSTDSYQSEEGAGYTLEEIQVTGVVTLPRGSGLSLSELTVETLTETEPVDADGEFLTTSLHTPDAPQLAMAINQQGNPVLMGMFGAPEFDGYGLSVESTARAFVLFDMAVLTLAPEQREIIAALLDKHPSYTRLQEIVAQAIVDDPVDPLLGDNHPELYEQAASMTADLLNQAELLPRASVKSGIIPISMMKQDSNDNTKYVDVEDDEKFGPQVVLVNKTWAYYRVNISVDGQPWTSTGSPSIYLVRNNLYGTINMEWPPVSYRSMFEPKVGDGMLSFTFTHDKLLTLVDLFMTTASTAMGVGEMATNDKGLRLLLSLKSNYADGFRDLMQAFPQHKQMSQAEAVTTYAWAVGYNGGKLLLDVGEFLIKEEISNAVGSGLTKKVLKFIVKKAAKPIALAYGSADMTAIIYSYNSAPELVVFKGEQRYGIYPAVEMECKAEASRYGYVIGEPIYFYKSTTNVPERQNHGLYYLWEFGDGDTSHGYDDGNEGWSQMAIHSYASRGNYNVKVTAIAGEIIAAECNIPVEINYPEEDKDESEKETKDNPCTGATEPFYNEDGSLAGCRYTWINPCPPYSEPIMQGGAIIGCEEPYSP